jgi:hypothetical protein
MYRRKGNINKKKKKKAQSFLLSSFLGSYSRSQLGQASSPSETEGRQRKREAKVAAHTGVKGEGGGEGKT